MLIYTEFQLTVINRLKFSNFSLQFEMQLIIMYFDNCLSLLFFFVFLYIECMLLYKSTAYTITKQTVNMFCIMQT